MGGGTVNFSDPVGSTKKRLSSGSIKEDIAIHEKSHKEETPENILLGGAPSALRITEKDLGLKGEPLPVPEIPELDGMSAADITLKAQAAREEERRKMAGRRGRQSTIVTGPLGIQSAASTTRGPI